MEHLHVSRKNGSKKQVALEPSRLQSQALNRVLSKRVTDWLYKKNFWLTTAKLMHSQKAKSLPEVWNFENHGNLFTTLSANSDLNHDRFSILKLTITLNKKDFR